jgi:hypothetical protein
LDNGPEFAGKTFDLWADFNAAALDFSRRGNPLTTHSSKASTGGSGKSA